MGGTWKTPQVEGMELRLMRRIWRDRGLPGGPEVKNAGATGSIHGWGARPQHCNCRARTPRLERSPHAATRPRSAAATDPSSETSAARESSLLELVVKNPPASAADVRETGSVPGSGRSLGRGHGSPLQDSCLENPMDRGAWRATVHGVAQSQARLRRMSTAQRIKGEVPVLTLDQV